jgi:hypothetical protein
MVYIGFNVYKHGRYVNDSARSRLSLKAASFISARIGQKPSFPRDPPALLLPRMSHRPNIRFHCCVPKFGALTSTYLAVPPPRHVPSSAPTLLLPSYFLSTSSVGRNVSVECHSLERCRSSVLCWDAGMVWKGLAWRGPFHRKRKPSMGLSFQICPIFRIVGLSGMVFEVCASVISELRKRVKRWTIIGRSLRLFLF